MNNALLTKAGISLCTLLFVILGGQLFYSPDESVSQGDLIIMPRRVVLDAKKRTQELNIANTGTDTAKYLISVVQYRMLENGAFEQISEPDPDQNFADKNFRFFPRSVTLAPNESQTVKVQVINTNELKSGEYRSHLYFRAVPKEIAKDRDSTFSQSLSVKLVPTFGIAIPVIIRNGNSTLNVNLEKPVFSLDPNGAPKLNMTFSRTGNTSAYGDIKVDYVAANGKTTQVGIAKGFAIYTPNAVRNFVLNLDKKAGIDYKKGKLNIVYTLSSDTKPVVLASSQVDL